MPIASTSSTNSRKLRPMPFQRKRVIIDRSLLQRGCTQSFDRPSLQGEQSARAALNEQDDEDQHQDLAQDGAGIGFEELVDDAERGRAEQGTEEIADAAEHHDHEGVDDVALAKVRADV